MTRWQPLVQAWLAPAVPAAPAPARPSPPVIEPSVPVVPPSTGGNHVAAVASGLVVFLVLVACGGWYMLLSGDKGAQGPSAQVAAVAVSPVATSAPFYLRHLTQDSPAVAPGRPPPAASAPDTATATLVSGGARLAPETITPPPALPPPSTAAPPFATPPSFATPPPDALATPGALAAASPAPPQPPPSPPCARRSGAHPGLQPRRAPALAMTAPCT